jgi:hypothetical protein
VARLSIASIACAATLATVPAAARAGASPPATPAPSPARPVIHTPATAVRTAFIVETNRLGQVTRVRSGTSSNDLAFNAMTYGNALQAFIRTQSGGAVAGTYRLEYNYDPRAKSVRRTVALVRAGGVNASAPGAVTVEAEKLAKAAERARAAQPSPSPLPDLKAITGHRHGAK